MPEPARRPPPGPVRPLAAARADRRLWVFGALLLAAVTAAYANHFWNGYHFDDAHTIVNNVYIRSLGNIPRFFADATTFSSLPTNQSYRPLVSTTLALDYFLGQGSLFFFHLSTFLLFLLQGVVMYAFFAATLQRVERRPVHSYVALAAVALYLLHPANAETINYIIARSDSLSTLLILVAFTAFLRWDSGKRQYLYLIPLALSCLAKPIGAIFAPLLLLYSYLFQTRSSAARSRLGPALRRAAPALLVALSMLAFIRFMEPPTWQAGGASTFHYIITQPFVLLHYFTTFFAPVGLSADTDWGTLPSILDPRFGIGVTFLAALAGVAIVAARRDRWRPVAFGLLWFLITLLPTSLIPLAEVMNDHRLFLPYVGLALAVSWAAYLGLEAVSARAGGRAGVYRVATALLLALLVGFGYGTHRRNAVWHTEETLWRDVTIKSPRNGRGWMNYGLALMQDGDYAGARRAFERALRLVPRYAFLHVNIGILEAATGDPVKAERHFLRAIRLNPGWPGAHYWYADFLHDQERDDDAIRFANRALRLAPAHLGARKLLMAVYLERGRFADLKALAEQTLRIAPGDAEVARYLAAAQRGRPSPP